MGESNSPAPIFHYDAPPSKTLCPRCQCHQQPKALVLLQGFGTEVSHGKVNGHLPSLPGSPLGCPALSKRVEGGAKEAEGGRGTLSLGAGGTLSCAFWERDLSWLSRSSPLTLAAECGGDLASWVVPRHLSQGQLDQDHQLTVSETWTRPFPVFGSCLWSR